MYRWFGSRLSPRSEITPVAVPPPLPPVHCQRCSRSFRDDRAYHQHRQTSDRHHLCQRCGNDHETHRALQVHLCRPTEDSRYGTLTSTWSETCSLSSVCSWSCESEYNTTIMSRATRTETNTRSNSSRGNGVAVGHARTETMNTQDSYWFSSDTTAGSPVHSREGSGATVRSAAEEGAAYCTTCDRMFTNQDALQTHMRASAYHPWYCEQCHVDLVRETDYVTHQVRIHPIRRGRTTSTPTPVAAGRNVAREPQSGPENHRRRSLVLRREEVPVPASAPVPIPARRSSNTAAAHQLSPTPYAASSRSPTSPNAPMHNLLSMASPPRITRISSPRPLGSNRPPAVAHPPTSPRSPPAASARPQSALSRTGPPAYVPPTPTPALRRTEGRRIPPRGTTSPLATPPTSLPQTSRPSLAITCPLCLDSADGLTTTLCGHVFCRECITAALNVKPECPVCRSYVRTGNLHPVYLNIIQS